MPKRIHPSQMLESLCNALVRYAPEKPFRDDAYELRMRASAAGLHK
ncbi:MAG: hypothetical protein LBU32_01955 [Clostridiales bacterium]|nr:hypothetical protein [Clostridiales bacterium]